MNRMLSSQPEHSTPFRFNTGKDARRIPKRVLVFIHVFKTGGNSIKDLFMELAGEEHNLGYATIIRGKLRNSRDRAGKFRNHQFSPVTDPETLKHIRHNMDMVGGHMLFDSANALWPELAESAFGKFAYVRNPLHRFVSGIIFVNRTKKRAVNNVRETVEYIKQKDLDKKSTRIRYWKDLATEAESKNPELLKNYEKQLEIIKSRMDKLIMIGVVERWAQSLKLLQNIVNPGGKELETARIHVNKNMIPTREVIAAIKCDDALHRKLLDFLRYEQEIYNYGLSLHLAHCEREKIQ
jgi:hypothetical protein